ncbi:uncharacterized protein K444DRAFT_638692 [Hyaloscypha bicolor E]|uniref:Uncharacterized protein n=1 Tax=Hyaloscypha bicolor E TaxID=1095630 RepID=A0A2J6SEI7_9HELO|nr:uncharacterized protein K444DRAFT_638692 [Hyaloscypha bicolor E]PMD49177.1 hypothetical protein K444DRAFT_638692 [Hyaloscypha bicolor E]
MQGNAVIAVIIGGLTAMGLLLWGLSSWWLSLQRKWAEDLKARQDRQATTERAGTAIAARSPPPPRNPAAPRVHFASPVAWTAGRPQTPSPGSTDTSDLTQTS